MTIPPVNAQDLKAWSQTIHEICGISLDDSKAYLIETRLGKLLIENGFTQWSELLHQVKMDSKGFLKNKVINAITTNETSFFRDTSPFDLLQHKLLPDLIDKKKKERINFPIRIRILSAACSTGQEVYSIAIICKELFGNLMGYDLRVLGIDISEQAIAKASYGQFNRFELERGIKGDQTSKYFQLVGENWKIKDELRALVTFQRANLLEPLPRTELFDIIFCRNVAIYFTEIDKIRLFKNLEQVLDKKGALIIGATESILGLCPELEAKRYLRSVFYQKKEK